MFTKVKIMLSLCYVILIIISVGNNGYVAAVDLTAVNEQRKVVTKTIQENDAYNWTISATILFDVIIYELLVSPRIEYCDLKVAITEEAGYVGSPMQEYTCINETARYYRSASSKISVKIKDSSLYFQENDSFKFRFYSINNATFKQPRVFGTFNSIQKKTVKVTQLPIYIWFPAVLNNSVTLKSEKCVVVTGLTGTLSKVPNIADYITAYTALEAFTIGGNACGFGDYEAIDIWGTMMVVMTNWRNGIWIKAESSSICTRNVKNITLGNTTEVISPSYSGSMMCHWLITTFDGNNVIDVNMEPVNSPTSGIAFALAEEMPLAVNGTDVNILGGSSRGKESYVTTTNRLQISFYSSRILGTARFQITLTVRPKVACGYPFLAAVPRVQYLTSPNYPGSYPNGMNCRWEIGVNKTTHLPTQSIIVTVEFLDLFQAKSSDYGDYLNITKGHNVGSPLLAHLCGDGRPPISWTGILNGAQEKDIKTYQIFNDIAVVNFKSDSDFVARGFNISYYLYDTARSCNSTIVVHENPNYFQPKNSNGSNNYTRKNLCHFTLVKPPPFNEYVIVAEVVEARLPGLDPVSRRCTNNRVALYEGWKSDDSRRLGTFCGNINEWDNMAYVAQDKMFIRLLTVAHAYHNEGFRIRYYLAKSRDHRLRSKFKTFYLTAQPDHQNFTSPNYPYQYERNLNYRWIIKSNISSRKVVVKVIDCDLTPSTRDTQADHVVVKNSGKYYTQLGRFFGREKPNYTSDGSELKVQFISNRYEGNRGFKIQYYTIASASEEESGWPIGRLMGLVIGISGTLSFAILIWCIIRRCKRKKTRLASAPTSTTRSVQNHSGDFIDIGSNNIVSFDHYSRDRPIEPPPDSDPPNYYDMVTRPPPSYDTLSIHTLPPSYDTLPVQAAPPSYSSSARYKPAGTKKIIETGNIER